MTTTEIDHYIYTKQIPLSFVWVDGKEYHFTIFCDGFVTTSHNIVKSLLYYPKWRNYSMIPEIRFTDSSTYNKIYSKECIDFKTVLTDFLFWWELNKSRCSQITYYSL